MSAQLSFHRCTSQLNHRTKWMVLSNCSINLSPSQEREEHDTEAGPQSLTHHWASALYVQQCLTFEYATALN